MGTYAPFQPCPTCKSQVHPDDLPAHVARHAAAQSNAALIKVLIPGLDLSLF